MDTTILDPDLDPTGKYTQALVHHFVQAFHHARKSKLQADEVWIEYNVIFNITSTACCTLLPSNQVRQRLHHAYATMVLKVRFTLGIVIFFDFGKQCSQWVCVASFITNKLPFSSITETFSWVCLCFNENFLAAPRLNEVMAEFCSNDFSQSLCQAMPSIKSLDIRKNITAHRLLVKREVQLFNYC